MTTMIVDDLGRIPMSPYLTATLTRAADYATAQSHREVTLEHLLLALAEDPEATVVLKSSNIDLQRLTAEVSDYLGRSEDRIESEGPHSIVISDDLRRILEAAAAAARQGRRREINGAIVLAAIVGDGRSTAANLLRVQGLTFEEAIRALQRATSVPPPEPAAPAPPPPRPAAEQRPAPPQPAPAAREPDPQPEPPPRPVPDLGPPPPPDLTRPASTEEILASARERLQHRANMEEAAAAPARLPRANYPDLGGPPSRSSPPAPAPEPSHEERDFGAERPGLDGDAAAYPSRSRHNSEMDAPIATPEPAPSYPAPSIEPPRPAAPPSEIAASSRGGFAPSRSAQKSSGPFAPWPMVETGQLVENIPRRMRVGVPVIAEARIARAHVKALTEGLQGGGAAFPHEILITKAMSVRLRAPDGGFSIENRSPETQWIENVLGFGADDYASWRWTVTPRARGRRQLQLIVSARTMGSDGMTAETALPDQIVDVKIAINYGRTLMRWSGWIAAAIIGGLLAKFGEAGFVILRLLAAKYLGITFGG